jgi:mRNA interferase MazF
VSEPAFVCPERGHLVWLSLDPQSGHEQAGRRPALVLSPASYNGPVGLALVCPVTGRAKGYPFEVPLPPGLPVSGVVLADHVKCLDWRNTSSRRPKGWWLKSSADWGCYSVEPSPNRALRRSPHRRGDSSEVDPHAAVRVR